MPLPANRHLPSLSLPARCVVRWVGFLGSLETEKTAHNRWIQTASGRNRATTPHESAGGQKMRPRRNRTQWNGWLGVCVCVWGVWECLKGVRGEQLEPTLWEHLVFCYLAKCALVCERPRVECRTGCQTRLECTLLGFLFFKENTHYKRKHSLAVMMNMKCFSFLKTLSYFV